MTDRVREAVFSILGSSVVGARVLDLFSGGGSLSCEALSRGASSSVLVDRSKAAARAAIENLDACGFLSSAEVIRGGVEEYVRRADPAPVGFDLVFIDPPYAMPDARVSRILTELEPSLAAGARVVIHRLRDGAGSSSAGGEEGGRDRFEWPAGYRSETRRRYGGAAIHIGSRVD